MTVLTAAQRELLNEVAEVGGTARAIAGSLGRTTSSVQSALKRLEARGLTVRDTYQQRDGAKWFLTDTGERAA